MANLLELLAIPGAVIGALAGVGLAIVFHWLAPEGTDTVSAGAWFVGLGWLLGMAWSLFSKRKRNAHHSEL